MHTYNTRANKHYAYHELIALDKYPDGKIIEISLSGTGKGHHLRWHWSKASLEEANVQPSRERSPSNCSDASDASDASYTSGSSSISGTSTATDATDATELIDGDGDSVMGDDERFRTPQREMPYHPGSVAETPRRGRIIKLQPHADGGFDCLHEQDNSLLRLSFSQDGQRVAIAGEQGQQIFEQRIQDALEDIRRSATPSRDGSTEPDDDASSVASDATVIVDPRATPEPTLFNRAMPLVRHPTLPADYDFSAPGPSRGQGSRLPTIQENGRGDPPFPRMIQEQQEQQEQPSVMRIHRGGPVNDWVREGSLGPDAIYNVDTNLLPPKVKLEENPAPVPAPQPQPAPAVRRGGRLLAVPVVEIRTSPRRKQ